MTHVLLLLNDQSILNFEDQQSAQLLAELINRGVWDPPAPVSHLLNDSGDTRMRAVILGNWVVVSLEDPQELPRAANPADRKLTNRQHQVLEMISQGMSNKQISIRLGISQRTLNMHIANIKNRLNAETSAQSVAYGTLLGYVKPGGKKSSS